MTAADRWAGAPIPVAVSFVDAINRADRKAFERLMADDYVLQVFDELPERGHAAGVAGMAGYCAAFPRYLIHPLRLAESQDGAGAAILGFTTGSHLGLRDDEERAITLIWLAGVRGGQVTSWTLVEDTTENRERYGLA